jgi:diaminopimelate epimerase
VEKISDNEIFVRTYERGVEDETYSCGTGVTASALTFLQKDNLTSVKVKTLGGNLKYMLKKMEILSEHLVGRSCKASF